MPMPADEASWDGLHVMFATAAGTIRRNALSDFTNINRAGKRAMKLDEGDKLIEVMQCNEGDDVLLATRPGQADRFDRTRVVEGKGGSDRVGRGGRRINKK